MNLQWTLSNAIHSFKYPCNRPMSFCWLQPALAGTPAETPGPSTATGTRGIVWTASVTAQETNSRKTAAIYSLFYNKVFNIISYSSILIAKKRQKKPEKLQKSMHACPHRGAKLKVDTVVKDNYIWYSGVNLFRSAHSPWARHDLSPMILTIPLL